MGGRKELEQELNNLPPKPYKPTADLRELHKLFHKAAEIDEGVPYTIHSLDTKEDILALVESIESVKPTNLGQALKLIDEIEREAFSSDYHPDVLRLALRICLDHNHPDKIGHNY